MSESPQGLDLEKLQAWFSEHVAPVDALRAQVIGHGRWFWYPRLKAEASIDFCVPQPSDWGWEQT